MKTNPITVEDQISVTTKPQMSRSSKMAVVSVAAVLAAVAAVFILNDYWIHRFDTVIEREARIYRLEEALVWSVIYEETYFRPWMVGTRDEVGLMQVTPTVAREWGKETGLKTFEELTKGDPASFLSDPERNIQIGSWYLEKLKARYRGFPAETAMTLAAYNAGPSRVEDWTKGRDPSSLSEEEFIDSISIPSTKTYVASILRRAGEARREQSSGEG